jgi:hypothetical protein
MGGILTLELNQRGVVVVIDDSGIKIANIPLSIYLKQVQQTPIV